MLHHGGPLAGVAVHVAARVAAAARGGQVLVSDTVAQATLGVAGIELREHGRTELRGVPGRWVLHAVVPGAH